MTSLYALYCHDGMFPEEQFEGFHYPLADAIPKACVVTSGPRDHPQHNGDEQEILRSA